MYRLRNRLGQGDEAPSAPATVSPHVLGTAKRPNDAQGILPEYDGSLLIYNINVVFPYLYQAAPTFENWSKDPAQNGNEAEVDFWRKMGKVEINRHFDFVRESNSDVADWYNKISDFASTVLRGIADSANAIVAELSSWPKLQVPPEIIQATIDYLQEWSSVSTQAESAISQANTILQGQLSYADDMIAEGLRYADVLHANYDSEVKTLRAKVKELEAQVLKLMEENNQLREKLAEQGRMMNNLLALIQAGGDAAGGILDKVGDNASKIAAPLAFGGVSALLLYGAIALGAFFLLRKI